MSLQYISDSNGKTTGVFIPIKEWNVLKEKIKDIEDENFIVPEWQKEIVRDRIKNTKPEEYLTWKEIEKQLKI
ncbi:MAG: hypothetical protein WD048_15505 [Chitinophagales bacterium]